MKKWSTSHRNTELITDVVVLSLLIAVIQEVFANKLEFVEVTLYFFQTLQLTAFWSLLRRNGYSPVQKIGIISSNSWIQAVARTS